MYQPEQETSGVNIYMKSGFSVVMSNDHLRFQCANTLFTDSLLARVPIIFPQTFNTHDSHGPNCSPYLFLWHRLPLLVQCPQVLRLCSFMIGFK